MSTFGSSSSLLTICRCRLLQYVCSIQIIFPRGQWLIRSHEGEKEACRQRVYSLVRSWSQCAGLLPTWLKNFSTSIHPPSLQKEDHTTSSPDSTSPLSSPASTQLFCPPGVPLAGLPEVLPSSPPAPSSWRKHCSYHQHTIPQPDSCGLTIFLSVPGNNGHIGIQSEAILCPSTALLWWGNRTPLFLCILLLRG